MSRFVKRACLFAVLLILPALVLGELTQGVSDGFYSWTPKFFRVHGEVLEASLQDMEKQEDPSFIEQASQYPGFLEDFVFNFKFYYEKAFNRQALPVMDFENENQVIDAIYWRLREVSESLLNIVKYGEIWTESTIYYGYCEKHPDSEAAICEYPAYSANYAFVIRSLSNPTFVSQVCEAFAQPFIWNLEWGAFGSKDYQKARESIEKAYEKIGRALVYLENGGTWDVSDEFFEGMDAFSLQLEIKELLWYRHLDQGPALMSASLRCLNQIQEQFDEKTKDVQVTDVNVALDVEKAFQMNRFQLPKGVNEIKNPFPFSKISRFHGGQEKFYFLSRQLPENHIVSPSIDFDWEPVRVSLPEIQALVDYINLFDSSFEYRLLDEQDFRKGIFSYEKGGNSNNRFYFDRTRERLCVPSDEKEGRFNKLVLNPKTGEVVSHNYFYGCDLVDIVLERRAR